MSKIVSKLTGLVLVALVTLSFTTLKKETKSIKTDESKIEWVGKKIGGQHTGDLMFKSGDLIFKGEKLVGGSFVVDMSSINVTDLSGKMKGKLEGHLKADDFFGVDKHATSTLVFTKVKGANGKFAVTADITIKGITESINFDLLVKGNTATASLKVDRTKHGIKYGSSSFFDNLKDKAIDNEFELNVALKF
ncbi:YceI family protein [Flavicella sediminum]|uniref:YceI family protein n=1 Tax=Flavicella sediminum TaxID=2585141 RepID=UPI0011214C2B|nr:YceI family protein [Flavicella sediminum]